MAAPFYNHTFVPLSAGFPEVCSVCRRTHSDACTCGDFDGTSVKYADCPVHGPETVQEDDSVNHPSHYTAYKGLEVIDLTEQMNFNRGNAVKYICRAGFKDPSKEVEDLEKAAFYINREIERISKEKNRE